MASRMIPGPEQDLLTLLEVAAYLRIDDKTLLRIIKKKDFPEGVYISPGKRVWSGDEVGVYCFWMRLKSRMLPDVNPDEEKAPGLSGTTEDETA